ncbi:hypothetical protein AB0L74_29160 [Streptomyces sp. NPDC052020]|uniref:hypothetical protein n=1 Tax=Streptomyces sp. NPDC052020 TaxID=3155677 RepID=UPI00341BE604
MISQTKIRPGDGRYLFRGVKVGDGHRAAGTSLRAAQDEAGVPPGTWKGRGLAAVGLAAEGVVPSGRPSCSSGKAGTRTPTGSSASSWRRARARPARARRATVLGRPIEHNRSPKTDKAKERIPWLGMHLVFRPRRRHTSRGRWLTTRPAWCLELCQDIARDKTLAWMEDAVAHIR